MKIDTNIYGSQEEWLKIPVTRSSSTFYSSNTLLSCSKSLYLQADEQLQKINEPINKSVVYAAFKTNESDWGHYYFVNQNLNDPNRDYSENPLYVDKEIYETIPVYNYINQPNFIYNDRRWGFMQTISSLYKGSKGTSGYNYIYPITLFNLQHICNLIYVYYVKVLPENITYNTITYTDTLNDFYSSSETNRYIIGYYFVPYISRNETNNTREQGNNTGIDLALYSDVINVPPSVSAFQSRNKLISYVPFFGRSQTGGNNIQIVGSYGVNEMDKANNSTSATVNRGNPQFWKIFTCTPLSPSTTRDYFVMYLHSELLEDPMKYSYYKNMCIEHIKREIAKLGFWFTDNITSASSSVIGVECDDVNMYCPAPPVDGLFTGEYYAGAENKTNDTASWTDNARDKTGYNPIPIDGEDTNVYRDVIDGGIPLMTGASEFTNFYVLDSLKLGSISDWLWATVVDERNTKEFLQNIGLIGDNPINALVNLVLYPFKVFSYISKDYYTFKNVTFGYNSATYLETGNKIIALSPGNTLNVNDLVGTIEFGELYISPHFFNFFDYEPYTALSVYIPFVGFINLTPSQVIGRNLKINLKFELLTSACIACVYIDNTILVTKTGICSINIPVSGVDSAQYVQSVSNSIFETIQSVINIGTNAGSAIVSGEMGNVGGTISGISGAISSATNAVKSFVNRDYLAPQYSSSGSYTANSSAFLPLYAYIQITRPVIQDYDKSLYRQNIGYACNLPVNLSTCTGYCEFSQITFKNIDCTETELRELYSMLQNGVYL